MSYQVYITRGKFWAENQGQPIAAEEWLQCLRMDAQLTHDDRNGPYFALLKDSEESDALWLDWFEGNIYTSYPNRRMQRKMLQLADQLGAIVQGDDGEIYTSIEDFPAPTNLPRRQAGARERLPAYQRRERLFTIITYATIAAVIVAAIVFDLW